MTVELTENEVDIVISKQALEGLDIAQPQILPALTLAYIGDVVYELEVRRHILASGIRKVDDLHRAAVNWVRASRQAEAARMIEPDLTEQELSVFHRGRNAKSHNAPKNVSPAIYHVATGLEALVGYWYLSGNEQRLNEFFTKLWQMEA